MILWNEVISDAEMLALMPEPDADLLGDANGDGVVDIFDVNVVSAQWGTTGPDGDVNEDGIVDIFDVNVISANWGATSGGGSVSAVPEPSSFALLFIAALAGCVKLRPRLVGCIA